MPSASSPSQRHGQNQQCIKTQRASICTLWLLACLLRNEGTSKHGAHSPCWLDFRTSEPVSATFRDVKHSKHISMSCRKIGSRIKESPSWCSHRKKSYRVVIRHQHIHVRPKPVGTPTSSALPLHLFLHTMGAGSSHIHC